MAKEYKDAAALYRLLERRYPDSQYALFPEVADSTGYGQSRWADAVAFNLWPSRGLEISGFEIKVSRSDWLSELKDHEKSSAVQRYCHRWWIVAGSRKLVKPEELPSTWGLLVPRGKDGLEAKVQAPLLKPKKITRKFVAAVMRRAAEGHKHYVKSIRDVMYKEVEDSAREYATRAAKREIDQELRESQRKNAELESKIFMLERKVSHYERIESLIGADLTRIEYGRVIRLLSNDDINRTNTALEEGIAHMERGVERLQKLLESGQEIEEKLKAIEAEKSCDG